MHYAERQEEILRLLKKKKHMTVLEIASEIYASSATIRRDIKALEKQRLITRLYGGVMLSDHSQGSAPLSLREQECKQAKHLIARCAVGLVNPSDTVILDASSSAMFLAGYLDPGMNLTVITNCLSTATLLCERGIRTYCSGGLLDLSSAACFGSFAERNIEAINANVMFFSAQALSLDGSISDSSEVETALRRLMLARAARKYFLCDSSKIGKRLLFSVCNASALDAVISDEQLPDLSENVRCIVAGKVSIRGKGARA